MKLRDKWKSWWDMLPYLVHFAGREADNQEDVLFKIFTMLKLKAGEERLGAVYNIEDIPEQRCVCFTEIPFGQLSRVSERWGGYAIGFHREAMTKRKVAPVWYLTYGTPAYVACHEMVRLLMGYQSEEKSKLVRKQLMKLTPFVDYPGDQSDGAPYTRKFEHEREWRHVGNFKFTLDEVAFVVMPEDAHEKGRRKLLDLFDGPYECPLVDATWSRERVVKLFKEYEDTEWEDVEEA